ncbi:hypothetical protein [uncultured Thiodictyon sp.]|uniref:hypothetical protein n=1 Tax=uncultured Thiodictyon sp. TaxID=1846217 RepID=UPI0025FA5C8B|nr:hypothetical protein [uncultured Thiodictyon sp.]
MRRFRTRLNAWPGIDQAADDLQRRLTQMEDAIRTTSTLRTQGLLQVLSVYGPPFVISGGITTQMGSLLNTAAAALQWGDPGASLLKLGVYLGLASVLIAAMRLTQHLWLNAVTRLPELLAPPDAPGPPTPAIK